MIEALYKIGKIQEAASFLEELVEEIGDNYKYVFKILFDISNPGNISYQGIELEEFDPVKKMKYFYKPKKGNSADFTPTSKVTTLLKTLNLKSGVFDKMINDHGNKMNSETKNFILLLKSVCNEKREKIFSDIKNKSEELDILKYDEKSKDYKYKDGAVITLGFIKDDVKLYVGDLEYFTSLFSSDDKSAYKDYYEKYSKTSKAFNKECYICKHKSEEIWGFVNTYNFYTADKDGMISGGFKQELAWKNYPVCSDCAEMLDRGKKYIEKNLKYRFCGFNYFLIPETVLDNDEILRSIIKNMKKYEDFSLSDAKANLIDKTEEIIIKELSRENNAVNFNFLFYEINNAAFNILLYMQEIAPTRLKYLIEEKDKIDKTKLIYDLFKEIPTKKDPIKFNFSFTFIREFFPKTKIEGNFDKYFLEIINSIFLGKNISADFLFSRFMAKIRPLFLEENWIEPLMLKSYKILLYLETIKILDRRKGQMTNSEKPFSKFFSANSIFDDDVKKALFLEGVLAQKLLNVQYKERKATPFRARLNGLKIDEKVAKRLLPEMMNKLEEYGKNYTSFKEIEAAIGEYMLNSSFSHYSIDEMSYYFTLGMTLEKHFRKEDETINNEEEDHDNN